MQLALHGYARISKYDQDGKRTIQENGWLPGIGGAVEWKTNGLEVFGAGRIFRADLDYDGKLQNGTPFGTETGTRMAQVQVGARYRFTEDSKVMAAVEYDDWKRNIKGIGTVLGLGEDTHSRRFLLGLERDWQVLASGKLSTAMVFVFSEAERLTVHFANGLDDATLRARSAAGFRFQLTYAPSALPKFAFGAEFDTMKVPRSRAQSVTRNGARVGELTQPEHRRSAATVFVRYLF